MGSINDPTAKTPQDKQIHFMFVQGVTTLTGLGGRHEGDRYPFTDVKTTANSLDFNLPMQTPTPDPSQRFIVLRFHLDLQAGDHHNDHLVGTMTLCPAHPGEKATPVDVQRVVDANQHASK